MRSALRARANTTLVHERGVRTLQQFLRYLTSAPGIALPADNLVIVSHASEEGWLLLPLDSKSGSKIDFETLEQVADRNTIRIGANILDPNRNPAVHIKGCAVGSAPQLLRSP